MTISRTVCDKCGREVDTRNHYKLEIVLGLRKNNGEVLYCCGKEVGVDRKDICDKCREEILDMFLKNKGEKQ